MIPAIHCTDFYKVDHRSQYPENTQRVYSNITPRSSRMSEDRAVCFWIQGFCKDFLINRFNDTFFKRPKTEVISRYLRRVNTAIPSPIDATHLSRLHDLGYLPIRVKAIPEGMLVPMGVPLATITNTHDDHAWLPNFLETMMCCETWQPMTSATISFGMRRAVLTGANITDPERVEFTRYQCHDFSMRGHTSVESAAKSGAGHLLSFYGTDTVPALDYLEEFYGADPTEGVVGGSIPATEHSVMCMGGELGERETILRLVRDIYPAGPVSVVIDTWDYWRVINEILPTIRDVILARDGKVVFRPDSGDPEKIICGDPEAEDPRAREGTMRALDRIFGHVLTSRGYRRLNDKVGVIYGDSINPGRLSAILANLMSMHYATTNMVFGVGSYTFQHVTRDVLGFAMKATWGMVDGRPRSIFKQPATDSGVKKSARGLLRVDLAQDRMFLAQECTPEQEAQGLLTTIFLDGKMTTEWTLADIRARMDEAMARDMAAQDRAMRMAV